MLNIIPNGTKVLVHTDQGVKKATIFDVHMGNFSQKGLSYWVKEWQGRVPVAAIEVTESLTAWCNSGLDAKQAEFDKWAEEVGSIRDDTSPCR